MTQEPIAIVGMGCRFPGGINDPESFWRLVREGRHALGEMLPDRDRSVRGAGASAGRETAAGFIRDVDLFDAAFFGISPREAERMDPQQRLLLEVSHEALEDAGVPTDSLSGSRTGVFVGLWLNDYEARLFADGDADFHMTTGTGRYAASGRVSFVFGFQGPSLTVDTACSSSLVAVHLACQSLRSGECEQAVAGGANVILQPHISAAYRRAAMLAPDGLCKFGDARANGYARSEGAAMVFLKRLSRAQADGDRIYAVIAGSAVNNDGRSGEHMATPAAGGQEQMLRLAYSDAGVSPGTIDYVEAHGTGTSVGDPVELGALSAVLSEGRAANHLCAVGSVKTNIGHTEGAAGIAGLIKAALVLHHREIPPSLHLEKPNPAVNWEAVPLHIPRGAATALPVRSSPAHAGVSAFGIAGTNAHIVLREVPAVVEDPDDSDARPMVVPLSAESPRALRSLVQEWVERFTPDGAPRLRNLAYTAACRRVHREHRLAVVAHDRSDLLLQLQAWLDEGAEPEETADRSTPRPPRRIVFVFPGQGSQWIGMGRELLNQEPVFRSALEECDLSMRPFVDWSLLELLSGDSTGDSRLESIECIQPVLVAMEIALARLWQSWGIVPDAVVGHSMGEVAAAHVSGALPSDDAMRVICLRSRLLQRLRGQGAMAVVELSRRETEEAVADLADAVAIAACNGPSTTVISGEPLALQVVLDRLEAGGVFCRRINVDVASHSPQVDVLAGELTQALAGLAPQAASVPFYSTVTAGPLAGERLDAAYWACNLRHPVLFSDTAGRLASTGDVAYVEVSPHPILLPAIQQTLQHIGRPAICVGSLRRGEPERVNLLRSLAELYTAGASVHWSRLIAPSRPVSLPTYPWQRERFWYEPPRQPSRLSGIRDHALLGPPVQLATGGFIREGEASTVAAAYLADHRVRGRLLLPAACSLEMALAAAESSGHVKNLVLENFSFDEPVLIRDVGSSQQLQVVLTPDSAECSTVEMFARQAETQSPWTRFARGRVLRGAAVPARAVPFVTESSHETAIDHYDELSRRALDYGESFRTLHGVRRDENSASAEVRLAATLLENTDPHRLHPVLLDACMQLILATLDDEDPTGTFIPLAVKRLQIHEPPRSNMAMRAVARRRAGSDGLLGDVTLFDELNQPIITAEGVRFHLLEEGGDSPRAQSLYSVVWRPQPRRERPAHVGGRWLILADESGVGASLAEQLRGAGDSCVVVRRGSSDHSASSDGSGYRVDPERSESFTQLLSDLSPHDPPLRGVVHLWSLDSALSDADLISDVALAQSRGVISAMYLVQALARTDPAPKPRLHLVTRGTQAAGDVRSAVNCAQAPMWGMAAVLANEIPELQCTSIDLPVETRDSDAAELAAELLASDDEQRVALRDGTRYVCRLVPGTTPAPDDGAPVVERTHRVAAPYRVVTDGRTLGGLRVRPTARRGVGRGEVEIEVRATGLNFMNVLSAMGIYPGYESGVGPLGIECAGVISATGSDVTSFAVGDEVVAMAFDSLATHAVADARLVVRKPHGITFAEAATIPVAYLTASYALEHLGRMAPGERVLIHSATGGVGMAAMGLARSAGAEIVATAGSPEKREYLRSLGIMQVFDSRSVSFADEVRDALGGEGVDLVLNSLGGEAIGRGLSLLRPYGRFLEIGKRDIHAGTRLGLDPFRQHLSFFAIDLDRGARERPALLGAMLRDIVGRVERGELRPLPHRCFPVSEVRDAFHLMAQAKHVGKIVIEREESLSETEFSTALTGDATYLITGGLGGLGLEVARWLVENGARHIVLLGRRAPASVASEAISKLERAGARVVVQRGDVARESDVVRLIERIDADMPPLRGIVHAAGVLADATVLELDARQMAEALNAKVMGAWILHRLTLERSLDFLVFFSSAAALLGIPGQANYAAANAFLDSLAHRRQSLGLPALSINWGPWSDVGMAAERDNRGRRLATQGLGSLSPAEGLAALELLLKEAVTHAVVMRLDAERWCGSHPSAARAPFLSELRERDSGSPVATPRASARQAMLNAASPRERQRLMEDHLREAVARVLRTPLSRVSLDEPLRKQGLDSLMTLELRNRLEADLGLSISAGTLWNYPTVELLAMHLLNMVSPPTPDSAQPAAMAAERSTADVDSDDATLLQSLLDQELAAVNELLARE